MHKLIGARFPVFLIIFLSVLITSVSFMSKKKHPEPNYSKSHPTKKLPNIVLIIADQFRADACKREGFPLNTTPFLDSLAKTGTWFNHAYCSSPACVPSRTSLLTGRFPNATRVRSNMNIIDATYKTDLFQILKSAGYSTALIGKNHTYLKPSMVDYWKEYSHLGVIKPETDMESQFNNYLRSTHFYMNKNAAPFPAAMQQPARIVDDANKWVSTVKTNGSQPFFLYMSFPEPHNPYQVSEPYYSMFPPGSLPVESAGSEVLPEKGNKWVLQKLMLDMGYPNYEENIPRIRSNYYGMMRLIDDQVRRLVNYLKEQGILDNTIILFVADHGDFTGEYGLIKKGVDVPECLARIPMLWYGPGIVHAKMPSSAAVSNVDILPTICDITGTQIPEGVQGRSLWPMLQGKDYPKNEFSSMIVQQGYGGLYFTDLDEYNPYSDDGTLVHGQQVFDELNTWSQSGMMRMIRKGDWKLVYDMQGNGQLYDLKKDPSEIKNLFGNTGFASRQMELLQDLLAWELRLQDPLPLPHPNNTRRYGYKRDPHNYWAPYQKQPQLKLKKNLALDDSLIKANRQQKK
jgi:arylsulfatase A-like enzyme